jgi:hypothetical protein
MIRTIVARYAGRCRRCGGSFPAGARIRWGGRGRAYHLSDDCNGEAAPRRARGPIDSTPGALASYLDPKGVFSVDGTRIGSVGPRCEDAPCCGCCD